MTNPLRLSILATGAIVLQLGINISSSSDTGIASTSVVPPQTLVSDTFTGLNGTLLAGHVPDVNNTGVTRGWMVTEIPGPLVWGQPVDVPVPGDYDGDGKSDPAMYRPSTGTWEILTSRTQP